MRAQCRCRNDTRTRATWWSGLDSLSVCGCCCVSHFSNNPSSLLPKMRECEHCGMREFSNERTFKHCARCKVTLYCSRRCQRHDWASHKLFCRPPKDNNKPVPECGLCGSRSGPFTRTECCNKLICDDEGSYVLLSYSRQHCHRNHRRYSQCAYHHDESHQGKWQECATCRDDLTALLPNGSINYDWAVRVANNPSLPYRFNFREDCLEFDWKEEVKYPTCLMCGKDINTWMDGYSMAMCHDGFYCLTCGGLGGPMPCPHLRVTAAAAT